MTTKIYYAVLIVLSIMRRGKKTQKPVPKKHIALDVGISTDYIEQIVNPIRVAGILTSVRGLHGGFVIKDESISVLDIYNLFKPTDKAPRAAIREHHLEDMAKNLKLQTEEEMERCKLHLMG